MRRFARRLSQIARLNAPDKDVPSVVLTRPSTASIFQFDEDASYFRNLGIKTAPTPKAANSSYLSAPSRIAKQRHRVINNNSDLSGMNLNCYNLKIIILFFRHSQYLLYEPGCVLLQRYIRSTFER